MNDYEIRLQRHYDAGTKRTQWTGSLWHNGACAVRPSLPHASKASEAAKMMIQYLEEQGIELDGYT
uniref:Uncharacterized protein n=1 Tax=Candidatus Kentrum sp. UNK TaxID=2126344 RepID=A0A451AP06_9GAMM|nr:MAG: hypothetical protein BECKUNK1418G_GA0071005_11598 [Candidatus Kentron sp. UNK]VFK73048.1 MAG: hypothetical protein BECKUNK1418H_GA0071006_11598 [Candidatus Kentron sp. UNK]